MVVGDSSSDAPQAMSSWKQLEVAGELEPEPLLIANPGRFVIFPIQHNDVSALRDR